jgi:hypothetical protein
MQTIKLDINNHSIFNTIMDFLNNLPQHDFKVKVEKRTTTKMDKRQLTAISLKTKGFTFNREEANER